MAKTLYVTDFDDTLAQTDALVYLVRGGKKTALTPAEYATFEEEPGDTFDFSEFEQLKNPKPIERFVRLVKKAVADKRIDKVAVLTARSHTKPISKFLQSIGIPGGVSIAALGDANPQRKANYIEKHINAGFTRIAFVDDSIKNIDAVKQLGQKYPQTKILTHQAKEHPKQKEPTTIKYKEIQDISKLSNDIKQRLSKLSYGEKGVMSTYFSAPKAAQPQYPATLAIDTETKQIVGWVTFMDDEFVRRRYGNTQKLDIFVDPKYRGQKIGTNLMRKAATMAKERGITHFKVNPHDKLSASAYGSLGAKYINTPLPLGLSKAEREVEKAARAHRQLGKPVSPDDFKGDDHEEATAKISIKNLLKTKITNPDTGNEILLQTALRNKSHPAHAQAVSAVKKYARQHNITIK